MNLRETIVPKSDQLNADDLLTGPITVMVTDIKQGSRDQPVSLFIDGGLQPFKPCKSMRRVLIMAWGDNGQDWLGRSMRLYCDPEVKFGGQEVGGIRISHLSHLERSLSMMLTKTRGKKAKYAVEPLEVCSDEFLARIKATGSLEELNQLRGIIRLMSATDIATITPVFAETKTALEA